MKSGIDYCVVTRNGKSTKSSVQDALKNRQEMMWCPNAEAPPLSCAHKSAQHFEHFPPAPKDCQYSAIAEEQHFELPSGPQAVGYPVRRTSL